MRRGRRGLLRGLAYCLYLCLLVHSPGVYFCLKQVQCWPVEGPLKRVLGSGEALACCRGLGEDTLYSPCATERQDRQGDGYVPVLWVLFAVFPLAVHRGTSDQGPMSKQ